MSCPPTLQWLLANARSVSVKNYLTPTGSIIASSFVEVFALDSNSVERKVLCSTVDGGGCFPTWTLYGLSSTEFLTDCMDSRTITIRISPCGQEIGLVEECLDLSRLLPLHCPPAVPLPYPANFLCVDMGGTLVTTERLYQALYRTGPISIPFFVIEEEDQAPAPAPSSGTAQVLRAEIVSRFGAVAQQSHRCAQVRLAEARARLAAEQAMQARAMQACLMDQAALRSNAQEIAQLLTLQEVACASNTACRAGIAGQRKKLSKLKFLLEARQIKLLADLQAVYPIERVEGGGGAYSIRGLELPADMSTAKDEELVASALGYAVHLVILASKYLEVPLRYQLLFMGSRSLVRDAVLVGQDNTFPLFATPFRKSIEKERFERAVLWLRGDVEQLLSARGMAYDSGRPLLGNLALLFDCALCPKLAI